MTLSWKMIFFSDNDDEVSDCELMSSDDGSNDDNTEGIETLIMIVMPMKFMPLKYNLGQNIQRLCHFLAQFIFTKVKRN